MNTGNNNKNYSFPTATCKLIVTEKPSVAQTIAKVLGAHRRKDGYIEGDDVLICSV